MNSETTTLSVSELNRTAKRLLEGHFDYVWVEGEISNFARPSSGHWYLTLKDERAILDFFIRFWKALHEHYHFVNDQSRDDDTSPFAELDNEFLVVNRYGIFQVEDILGVTRYERYCAIGSGASRAEGALEVLMGQDKTAGEIAEEAIRVAMKFDRASGGDVIVYDVKPAAAPRKRRKVSRTRRK